MVLVSAPDVVISGLEIRHSGEVAEDEDSGIFITARGNRTLIETLSRELHKYME